MLVESNSQNYGKTKQLMQQKTWLVYPVLLGGILAVSTASIFIRFAQENAPSLVIAALRLSFASLALAPLALTRHRAELAGLTRREVGLGLLSGVFLALHFASWISSLEFTSVASSVVLVTTTPLWVALAAPLVLKESISRGVWLGMTLALTGGILVALSQDSAAGTASRPLWGNFLAVSGAWAAAGYLLIGRRLRERLSLIPYIFVVYGMAALTLLGFMFAAGQSPLGYPPATYLWLLALALIPQLLGHSTFNWALGHLPASFVSITLLGEPIGSIILAFLILKESPSGLELAGGACILLGIFLASAQPPAQAKTRQ
ncbi:MAG: DMT family transporter [Anaerolineales bacterium]